MRWSPLVPTFLRTPRQAIATLEALQRRVDDAKAIPWPALAQSWQRDRDAFAKRVADRGWPTTKKVKQ